MKRKILFAIVAVVCPLLCGSSPDDASAKRKLEQIESDRLPAGARVTLTPQELNAWVLEQAREAFPDGVRRPAITLGPGQATGTALIDFGKIRRAQGHPPGWLASRLLDGERPVTVPARLRSGSGRATVDVESVEIAGVAINGPLLDFLIRNYLLSSYPAAKVGEPFEMGHRIDRIEVLPAAVHVWIGR